jgi:predicted enzyme related to lactoylglutathione lyase
MPIQLDNITLAAENLEEMVVFYSAVFDTDFKETRPVSGMKAFSGTISGIEFMLVPNSLVQINAQQGRHQMRYIVDDVEKTIETAIANGGSPLDEAGERAGKITGAAYDPDGNSLVFVQN